MVEARVTARDVARRAGVSQSAVSRVYTQGASVSEKTAEKVRQAARELGYRPNVLARSLITGRSRIIGLIVASLDNAFYPEVLEELSAALQGRGYRVMMFMAGQEAENIDAILEEILDYQVDGIVMASVAVSSGLARQCQAAGVPVVLFNRTQDDVAVSAVSSDNAAGGRRLAHFLAAGGHRRIGFIAGTESASTQRDREAGFRRGLAEHALSIAIRAVGDYSHARAAEATRQMFRGPDRPDAVFVANDVMAMAAMDTLRFEMGLSVPGDVSVVGFDDVPAAAWPAYDLTTVRQSAPAMVGEAVAILLDQIEAHAPSRRVVLDAPLIVRSSARKPQTPEAEHAGI